MEKIKKLIFYHDTHYKKMNKIRRLVSKEGIEFCEKLIQVQYSDIFAQSNYKYNEKIEKIASFDRDTRQVYNDKTAITLKGLKINGNDLIKIGFKGKKIGELLEAFYNDVLSEPKINDENLLKQRAINIFNKTNNIYEN